MRIAVVSDIHGNLTAFEAVLADLRDAAPDLVFHGGDLADSGSSPVEIVDRIRDLAWPGVIGNTDELLAKPETLEEVAKRGTPEVQPMWSAIRELAAATRERLGEARLAWLRDLPRIQRHDTFTLVHASPESAWMGPNPEWTDAQVESVYAALGSPVVVYGHIHRSFVRKVSGMTIINSGSVSLSLDGDPRAAYVLLDNGGPTIRRVDYEIEREIRAHADGRLPHNAWIAKTLRAARPQGL